MSRFHRPLALASFAGLIVFAGGCASKSNQASQNPDAGNYDDYYSEQPGGSDAGGDSGEPGVAQARPTSVSQTTASTKALARAKKLTPKKGAVKGKKGKPKRKKRQKVDPGSVVLDGVVPSMATIGSQVELFGSGLDQKGVVPMLGKKKQKVIERSEDRMVIEIVGGSGTLGVGQPDGKNKKGQKKFAALTKTEFKFATPKDNPLAHRTNASQGLIGNVYAIETPVEEVPAFDSLGAPIGTVAVDNLAIAPAPFDKKLFGRNEWFGIHFRGSLNVVEEGDYTICLTASSGALLFLDGADIVDNDGAHEAQEKCEEIFIEPGEYALDLLYYHGAAGDLGLTLSWAKDGGEKVPIPTESLFPPDDRGDAMLRI